MTRLRRGWTQRDVSDRCEQFGSGRVDDSNIAKYERGDLCPSPQSLASLAAALELQVDDLIILRKAVA
jgi:transcriptional regulator with XRE-family HTH domain